MNRWKKFIAQIDPVKFRHNAPFAVVLLLGTVAWFVMSYVRPDLIPDLTLGDQRAMMFTMTLLGVVWSLALSMKPESK